MTKNIANLKKDKLDEAFMKFMTDNGDTFVDATPMKNEFNKYE